MKVSPIISYNYQPKHNDSQKNSLSFSAHYDKYAKHIVNMHGDGVIYGSGSIKNYSHLFRNLKFYQIMPFILDKKFPNGAVIYDYACSAGYEASSIVMAMKDKLPNEKVEKFMPVYAFDCNPQIVEEAKKYKLKLNGSELKSFHFFENIKKSDFLVPTKIDRNGQVINFATRNLTNNIIFDNGNIFEDLESGKLSKKPCVLFIKNTWQFLTDYGSRKLAKSLYDNLKSKSLVFIGDEDIDKFYGMTTDKVLLDTGFKAVEDRFDITYKQKKNRTLYNRITLFEHKNLSDLCFEKP